MVPEHISFCRIDLGVAYLVTAIFGIAMTIIGSTVTAAGSGTGLIVDLADNLAQSVGPVAAGLSSSELSEPYLAAYWAFGNLPRTCSRIYTGDFLSLKEDVDASSAADTESKPYRVFQYGLAFIPMLGLLVEFREVQRIYGIAGVLFLPMLTIALLILNGRKKWAGELANRPATIVTLVSIFGIL